MRRRLLLALTLVAGVLVFPSSASATHDGLLDFGSTVEQMLAVDPTLDPPPNDGKHDFVVAGFQVANLNYGVSAHSGPLGEDAWGHVSLTFKKGSSDFKQGRWRVTCMNVVGNLAVVGAVPTKAASNDIFAVPTVFFFRDGGPAGGTPVEPDGHQSRTVDDPNLACRNPLSLTLAASALPIERGNILIHDAQP